MANQTAVKQKIEVSLTEYNLLRELYRQSKKQALLMRIIEAEENLKKRKIKKVAVGKFIKDI